MSILLSLSRPGHHLLLFPPYAHLAPQPDKSLQKKNRVFFRPEYHPIPRMSTPFSGAPLSLGYSRMNSNNRLIPPFITPSGCSMTAAAIFPPRPPGNPGRSPDVKPGSSRTRQVESPLEGIPRPAVLRAGLVFGASPRVQN